MPAKTLFVLRLQRVSVRGTIVDKESCDSPPDSNCEKGETDDTNHNDSVLR